MYALGESPFHVRGSIYLGVREHAQVSVPGGMEAVAAALPGAHREFFVQAFTAETWYDALPLRPLTEVMARLEGKGWEDWIRARAQISSQREVGGLMGRLRRVGSSPEKAIERLQTTSLSDWNFGQAEVTESEPGWVRLVLREVPQPLGSWFLATLESRGVVLLAGTGARQPEVSGRLIPKGRKANIGLVDVRVDLRWVR